MMAPTLSILEDVGNEIDLVITWSNGPGTVALRLAVEPPLCRGVAPAAQGKLYQALGEMGHLLVSILSNRRLLAAAGMSLEHVLDVVTDRLVGTLHNLAEKAAGSDADKAHRFPFDDTQDTVFDFAWCKPWTGLDKSMRGDEQAAEEELDPHHLYAAYVFEDAQSCRDDVATLVNAAGQHGYPVRYWWLSEVMALGDDPDWLLVCVHFPSAEIAEVMDLAEAFKETLIRYRVTWHDLETVAVAAYGRFGQPIASAFAIRWPDRDLLFPLTPPGQEAADVETGFAQWLVQVNQGIWEMAACGAADLPAIGYRALYDFGLTPAQAADNALRNAGFSRFA
jgi:hypothetical protein